MAYTIDLIHRGPQVIECIDLFDEARYGADKLFFRKRCKCAHQVKQQIDYALNESQAPQGGNPLGEITQENGEITSPIICLNRYHIPNKKFWNNTPPAGIANPYKASAAVRFSIRVHFSGDYAYIDFGCPWHKVMDEKTQMNAIGKTISDVSNFTLFRCHFISREDALLILSQILGLTVEQLIANGKPTVKIIEPDNQQPQIEVQQQNEPDVASLGLHDQQGNLICA